MISDDAPLCPFCHAPWSREMLDEFAQFSSADGCACCSGPHDAHQPKALPAPERDLCCAGCGKAIYRKP